MGADGLRSGVRAHAFGPESAHVRDLGTYTSYFPARTSLDLDGWELMYNLPGGRVCLLYPVGRDGAVRVLLAFRSPVRDVGDPAAVLREVFADAGWELPRLLPQIGADLYFARDGFVHVDGWSRGRAVLLGDAAFGGSVGMGTSMALVGAYVLAGELATGDDPATAFRRYEDVMRDYVAVNQKRDPHIDKGFAPMTRRGIWLRNQAIRLMTKLPGKGALTGDLQKTANAVTLPDYGLTSGTSRRSRRISSSLSAKPNDVEVGPDALGRHRLRDHHDLVLEVPAQHHLRRRHAVRLGDRRPAPGRAGSWS